MRREIRRYRPEDRAAMALVFYRAVREGAAAFYSEAERAAWAPSSEVDVETLDKLLDQWCYVATQAGQMTGFMSMEPGGYLDMAFVLPEVMGDGTAAALYDAILARAKAAALPRLTVRAAHQSQRFLTRRGWQVDRFERYQNKGQTYDLFHMSLRLTENA